MRAWLGELFPTAPSQPWTWRTTLVVVAALVGGTLASLLRQAGIPPTETIWAEDASIFLQGAYHGDADVLVRPYVGYLHVVPRIVAEVAAAVPPWRASAVFALAAAVVTAGAAVVTWFATGGLLRSPWLRGALAALVVLQPAAILESLNSIALVQWHLAFAACWVVLWRPQERWAIAASAAFQAVATLSAPLCVLLVPVALLRIVAVDRWRDRLAPAALVACGVVQVGFLLLRSPPNVRPSSLRDVGVAYVQRVLVGAPLGVDPNEWLWQAGGMAASGAVAVVVVVLLVVGALRSTPPRAVLAAGAVLLGAAMFASTTWLRGTAGDIAWPPGEVMAHPGSRYALVPILLLASAAAIVVEGLRSRGTRGWRVGVGTALVLVAVVTVADLRTENARTAADRWPDAVVEAHRRCVRAPSLDAVPIEATPPGLHQIVDVPCAALVPGEPRRSGTSASAGRP